MNYDEEYASFLVRFWTEPAGKISTGSSWQAEVESIQSGEQWRFATPLELMAFLAQFFNSDNPSEGNP
jgi:hypothetical protein